MLKNIIKIDQDKCIGCGICASTCHQGAIKMIDGKAQVLHEDYCDGLGRCLPVCPASAISFEEKEVKVSKNSSNTELKQWPIQINLLPVNSPYFDKVNLLVAADCTSFAYPNFHNEFIKGKTLIIGCPKLDECDYREKLTEILKSNDIKSITVAKMEVPCCTGLSYATEVALKNSGKDIPLDVITVSIDGNIL